MLYIVYSHNFPRKLFTWEVLALGLHYDVFGAVLGPDGLQTGQTNILLWSQFIPVLLCDDFKWEIWVISETWLDYSKLTCHISSNTNNVSNGFTTFKG